MATTSNPSLAVGLDPAPGTEGPALPPPADINLHERLHDEPEFVHSAVEQPATESHELANADHDLKGAAQLDHGQTEVKDLGWSHPVANAPTPLVGGLPNEELWTLIRRFNKV
jgi:hypothetical protein